MKRFNFQVILVGTGNTIEEAWANAWESCQDSLDLEQAQDEGLIWSEEEEDEE